MNPKGENKNIDKRLNETRRKGIKWVWSKKKTKLETEAKENKEGGDEDYMRVDRKENRRQKAKETKEYGDGALM